MQQKESPTNADTKGTPKYNNNSYHTDIMRGGQSIMQNLYLNKRKKSLLDIELINKPIDLFELKKAVCREIEIRKR